MASTPSRPSISSSPGSCSDARLDHSGTARGGAASEPGAAATISCPHSYPLFYEPLGLDRGQRFLEIGAGSGYGAAIAREVVGDEGRVISVEIDPVTRDFARRNLERAGYHDVMVALGDGWRGYPEAAPYDRVAVTAACPEMPPALVVPRPREPQLRHTYGRSVRLSGLGG